MHNLKFNAYFSIKQKCPLNFGKGAGILFGFPVLLENQTHIEAILESLHKITKNEFVGSEGVLAKPIV